ncbi:MAG TPA: DUF4129 domain-containing protein [Chloroflexota bacterium]|jgi:hypothetical protein|nr:DUF4129 domain-containing protein [Chloroflexota bacterium]
MTDSGLLPLGLALMRLTSVYPWALLLGLWTRGEPTPLLPAAALLALVGLPGLLLAWLRRRGWPLAAVRAATLAAGLAAALAATGLEHGRAGLDGTLAAPAPPVLALVLGLLLWRRGVLDAQARVEHDDLARAFGTGVLVLAGSLLLAAVAGEPSLALLRAEAVGHVVGFFAVGLTALALARLEEMRRGAAPPAPGREWLGLVLATVLLLLVAALGLAQLLAFDLIGALLRPLLWPLGLLLTALLLVVGLPIALLLELLVRLVRWLLPRLGQLSPVDFGGQRLLDRLRDRSPAEPIPPELLALAQWLAVGAVVALALWLVARAVAFRRERRSEDGVEEERDSVWNWALFAAAVRAWLAGLLARLARRPTDPAPLVVPAEAPAPPAATTIRQLYRELLRLAAARGAPRRPDATPYEHLPRLQAALGPDDVLADATGAYVRARYGPVPPDEDDVERLMAWWERRQREAPGQDDRPAPS